MNITEEALQIQLVQLNEKMKNADTIAERAKYMDEIRKVKQSLGMIERVYMQDCEEDDECLYCGA